jgi:regulator of cell morphogenesis and NO signaling
LYESIPLSILGIFSRFVGYLTIKINFLKLKIQEKMTIQENQIIGELVATDYRTASVFKAHNIDFCCNGSRTIEVVCADIDLQPRALIQQLESVLTLPEGEVKDYQSWAIDELTTYVETVHHSYVERKIGEIKPYLEKITRVHGEKHPELLEINSLFNESAKELLGHMKKEEFVLFPFIKKMVKMQAEGTIVQRPPFGTVENPIDMMHEDHDAEGERFRKIAALSDNYTVPADGCNTYKVTFGLLKEFEDDLHLHIHLENNIMFPKAIALEKLLFQN